MGAAHRGAPSTTQGVTTPGAAAHHRPQQRGHGAGDSSLELEMSHPGSPQKLPRRPRHPNPRVHHLQTGSRAEAQPLPLLSPLPHPHPHPASVRGGHSVRQGRGRPLGACQQLRKHTVKSHRPVRGSCLKTRGLPRRRAHRRLRTSATTGRRALPAVHPAVYPAGY